MQISLLRSESHLLKPNHTSCVTHLFLPPPLNSFPPSPTHPPPRTHLRTPVLLLFAFSMAPRPISLCVSQVNA